MHPRLASQFPVTKFLPPENGRILARPRLTERFANARLAVVCAGPGYGKTTLLSSVASASSDPYVWLSLDAEDAKSGRFLACLMDAVRLAGERSGEGLLAEVGSLNEGLGQEAVLAGVVNTLARYPGRVLFVIDNYERVDEHSSVSRMLEYLLTYLPSNSSILLGTRVRPTLQSVDRLLAQGEAIELTSADLRFNVEETIDLLAECFGLELGGTDVEVLDQRLEGWLVGLQSWCQEALAQGGSLDQVSVNPAGALRRVANYLRAEILDPQPPAVRRFLIESATVDELDVETCNAVGTRGDSGLLLEHLERHNLLVHRNGSEKLRYHRLFLEYLRDLLGQQAERRRHLALTAAAYFGARGDAASAIEQLLDVAEWEGAARWMVRVAPTVFGAGLQDRFAAWVERIPDAVLNGQPELLVRWGELLGWQGQTERAAACFVWAAAAPGHGDGSGGLAAVAASAQAVMAVARQQAGEEANALVDFHQRLLAEPVGKGPPGRPVLLSALALAQLSRGCPGDAGELVGQALGSNPRAADDGQMELEVLNSAGFLVPFMRGQFAEALQAVERARALAERAKRPQDQCLALLHAGDALVRLGRLEEARQRGEQALALARRLELRLHQADALRLLGSCLLGDRNESSEVALRHYLDALAKLDPTGGADRLLEARVCTDLSTLHRRSRQTAEAIRLARWAIDCLSVAGPGATWLKPDAWLALASALMTADPQEAEQLVSRARSEWSRYEDACGLARADFWLAVLAQARGLPEFVAHLQSAMACIADRPEVGQVFLEEPTHTVPLLVAAIQQGARSQNICDLLVSLGSESGEALTKVIDDSEVETRRLAASLLGRIGDVRARRPLMRRLKDEDPSVRESVRVALDVLGLPEPPFLRVRMFGHFSVMRDDELIADREWKTRKVKMLFKYLLVNEGRLISQERLIDLLWPEADLRAGSMNLRTTLAMLRRALEPFLEGSASRFIVHQSEGIVFKAEIPRWLDTQEFLEHYRAGRVYEAEEQFDPAAVEYETADRLYAGDFLEEDAYEDWTLVDRERYREIHSELLLRLADIKANKNELEEAVALCERVMARDSCREEVHRRLMALHWKAGRAAQAIRQYQACCAILDEELGVGPDAQTRRLFDEIQGELKTGPRRIA